MGCIQHAKPGESTGSRSKEEQGRSPGICRDVRSYPRRYRRLRDRPVGIGVNTGDNPQKVPGRISQVSSEGVGPESPIRT